MTNCTVKLEMGDITMMLSVDRMFVDTPDGRIRHAHYPRRVGVHPGDPAGPRRDAVREKQKKKAGRGGSSGLFRDFIPSSA